MPSPSTQETPPYAIEAYGLTKSYGNHGTPGKRGKPAVRVLDHLDLRVAHGSVFALLGPNGAGKTTAVRILATLTTADSGTARVAGYDVVADRSAVRRAISLTGQFAAVDETPDRRGEPAHDGPARRALPPRRPPPGRRAAGALRAHRRRPAARPTYSGGMRRRLDLAAGLVGSPSPA